MRSQWDVLHIARRGSTAPVEACGRSHTYPRNVTHFRVRNSVHRSLALHDTRQRHCQTHMTTHTEVARPGQITCSSSGRSGEHCKETPCQRHTKGGREGVRTKLHQQRASGCSHRTRNIGDAIMQSNCRGCEGRPQRSAPALSMTRVRPVVCRLRASGGQSAQAASEPHAIQHATATKREQNTPSWRGRSAAQARTKAHGRFARKRLQLHVALRCDRISQPFHQIRMASDNNLILLVDSTRRASTGNNIADTRRV